MILEVTARLNGGLCASCHSTESKAKFDKTVQGWIDNPETLPGTNGIPMPKDIGLSIAARQVHGRLFPTQEDKMEQVCHAFVDKAHNTWLFRGSSALNARQKHALAVETFYGEVCNGGLEQYLLNESGSFANWAVEGFLAIGIPEYSAVVAQVQRLFPDQTIPEDADRISSVVESLDDGVLEEIEKPFWERYRANQNEIREKLYAYLTGK